MYYTGFTGEIFDSSTVVGIETRNISLRCIFAGRWAALMRLHQDTCRPETCIPDEQLVPGYICVDGYMSPDTSCSSGILVHCISATLLFIYVTVDLYFFVSSNRRATNWRQFCRRYKKHVDGNKWIQLQVDTTCIRQRVSWCKRSLTLPMLLLLLLLLLMLLLMMMTLYNNACNQS